MTTYPYQERLQRCSQLMKATGLNALLLMPPGHAFFHGENEPPPLEGNVVIAVGNCGLYTGPWGLRVEDTIIVGPRGPMVLTRYPRQLEKNT